MKTRLRKLFLLNNADKIVLVNAWLLLGYFRLALLVAPFKRLTKPLAHYSETTKPQEITTAQGVSAKNIGYLVAVAARYTPWQSRCLIQVLTTQRLLAARHIPGQFYLGVRRGGETSSNSAELSAHAWLRCGDSVVNGIAGHEAFTVVSTFSWGETSD
ncbi:MAG: lasso peptide biosynthesis B2 protein [Cyanobacteria bacterium P01_F01_bin.53]